MESSEVVVAVSGPFLISNLDWSSFLSSKIICCSNTTDALQWMTRSVMPDVRTSNFSGMYITRAVLAKYIVNSLCQALVKNYQTQELKILYCNIELATDF